MKSGGVLGVLVLIVGGIILADLITHPTGVNALGTQANKFWTTSVGGLLGKS